MTGWASFDLDMEKRARRVLDSGAFGEATLLPLSYVQPSCDSTAAARGFSVILADTRSVDNVHARSSSVR